MNDVINERYLMKSWIDAIDRIAFRALVLGFLLLALSAASAYAQVAPDELTLQEAVELAKANNPTFLSTQNDQSAADWQVRESYAQFVPSLTTSIGGTWQEAGSQRFGTIVFEEQVTDWLFTGYQVDARMTIDGNTIFGVSNARANRDATAARIDAAEFNLESTVALQYMSVLRAEDQVEVALRQLERAEQNLEIVQTRVEAGAVAGTDGRQAEVDLGRAEVGLIQAERDLRRMRLLLSEELGVTIDEGVRLSSEFEVYEPGFDQDQLLMWSMEDHPSLQAFRAQENATRAAARQVSTGQYLPSLNLSASLRGQAQEALNQDFVLNQAEGAMANRMSNCEFMNAVNGGITGGLPGYTNQNCSQFVLDDAGRQAVLSANDNFPFNFTRIPMQISASVSLPIFTGFSRERQVSEMNNLAEDAEHGRRAEELRLRTLVINAYDNVVSSYRVVRAEERNRTLAEEQLQLQQRRYALGATGLLELLDAQTTMTTADQGYLNAVYEFHYSLIVLEAAAGRPLRGL